MKKADNNSFKEEYLKLMNCEAIFESSPVAMFILDEKTNIVMVNLAASKIFGGNKEDIVQHRPGDAFRCIHSSKDPRGCGYSEDCKTCVVRNAIEGLICNGGSIHNAEVELTVVRSGQPEKLWISVGVEPVNFNDLNYWCVAINDITEKKELEIRLKDTLNLLKSAGRLAKFGGWSVDLSDDRSYWSDEVAAIHEMPVGYCPLVKDGINFYAPEWRDKITQVFNDCAQKGIPYDEEMEILTSTGKKVWVRTNGEAVRDDKGVIYKVQGGFQDITVQKTEERNFKELMAKHKTFIDTVPDIIMEVDRNKVYTWANKAGYEFFGDDVIGKEASYYFEGKQNTYELVKPLFFGVEEIIYLESFQKRKDGKLRLLAWWCKVHKDSEGNAVGAVSSARDITEQRELENSLIRSEEKLRMVMDGVAVPIVFVDADLRYNFVNKAYADWYNTSKEEIEGKYIKDILAEDVYKRAQENYRTVLNGQQVSFDNKTIKDGKEKFVSVRMIPHYNKDKIVGFLSSVFDITELKQAEIELKKKNSELREANSVMVGRELKMIELKNEINELLKECGRKPKY